MTKLTLYQVDAFASQVFAGNPAAVIPLKGWLSEKVMLAIANENNLSETAFFVPNGDHFDLRWFTPLSEVDLCGHATLASAFILFERLGYSEQVIKFQTRSGVLEVRKSGSSLEMNFPIDILKPCDDRAKIEEFTGVQAAELWKGKTDILVQVRTEQEVIDCKPNYNLMAKYPVRGFIITAEAEESDVVCRCFFPAYGIPEDPVTGSAHTTLAAFWPRKLNKTEFTSIQASHRSGLVICGVIGNRVRLIGNAVLYLEGTIYIPNLEQKHE